MLQKKKKKTNDSAENLAESSPVNVATKIIAPSQKKDQQQANEPHPRPSQHHRKKKKIGGTTVRDANLCRALGG